MNLSLSVLPYICTQGLFIVLGIIGTKLLITFHELGHFAFCKLFNISTPSFSIGLGPRIFTKKIGGTEFSISLIPIGGYVEIAGNAEVGQGEQKFAHSDDKTSFNNKTFCQKIIVMLGGIIFNIIFACIVFSGAFFVGIKSPYQFFNSPLSPVIKVKDGATSVLQTGDRIVSINGKAFDPSKFDPNFARTVRQQELAPEQHETMTLEIMRKNEPLTVEVPMEFNTVDNTTKGIIPNVLFYREDIPARPLFASIKEGISFTGHIISMTVNFFFSIPAQIARGLGKNLIKQVAGPIGLISMLSAGASSGVMNFLIILSIISINLAIINFVPLPVFDGGQILICIIEDTCGRQLPLKIKEGIFIATWVLLLFFMIFMSFMDIRTLITKSVS